LQESAEEGGFKNGAATQATNIVRAISSTVGLLLLAIVWGVDFGAIMLFASTTLTLLGVALFASWSILSNITACVILLLHPAFRRGTFIRVIDADNYVEGYVSELTLFNTKLVTESREVIYYPNNLLLGKPSIINPRDRLEGVGKLKPAEATLQIQEGDQTLK
ncbi:MAG: mechanosensitive ion channel domain-containing protein, partial [Pseudohongiellaceae bacterium]